MDYTLQQLRYLVAVADHGSVSAAARSLYVSQPGVSAAVSDLENSFGVQCFVRHHAKGVTLTAAGKSLVAAARNVLALAEDLRHHASGLNNATSGSITFGCCPTLGYFLLPQVLEMLGASYPEINMQVRMGNAESLQSWLRDGTIEIALMFDLNCDPVVYSKHYVTAFRPHALLPKSHPLASAASVSPSDLAGESLILPDCEHYSHYILSAFQNGQKRPNIKHRISNVELVLRLVSSGQGYTILNVDPQLIPPNFGLPLRWIPLKERVGSVSVVLTSARTIKSSGQKAALISACDAVMQRIDNENSQLAS